MSSEQKGIHILNPFTNRQIKVGGQIWKSLVDGGKITESGNLTAVGQAELTTAKANKTAKRTQKTDKIKALKAPIKIGKEVKEEKEEQKDNIDSLLAEAIAAANLDK